MTNSNRRRNRVRLHTLLAAVALVAASCGSTQTAVSERAIEPATSELAATPLEATAVPPTPVPASEPTPVATSAGASTPDSRAGETVDLNECADSSLECGIVTVPVDYNDESLGTLDIAIAISRATSPDDRIGYLLVNPGGPGASGVAMAESAEFGPGFGYSAAVLERFDIVGFDPRGVAESDPSFECGARGEQLKLLNQIDEMIDTAEESALGEQAVELCTTSMGPVAALLGSESVARDMDEIRKALGADQISYYGASYGSALGAWYATLFPSHVRAMVIDGADNPVDDRSTQEARIESALGELRQFEVLLNEALLACDSIDCPIFNGGDPIGFYLDVVDELELVEEALGGDKNAGALAVITPLYSEFTWPALWEGLAALKQGDAQPLVDQALVQLDDVGVVSFTAHVNCLDSWSLQPSFDRAARLEDEVASRVALFEQLPLLAVALEGGGADPCAFYDTIVGAPLDRPLNGSGVPILVIGNPADPATPFTESVELVESTLNNGYLVEVEHAWHVVYPSNSCANDLIHEVLIDLSFPTRRGTVCEREEPEPVDVSEEDLIAFMFQICESAAVEGAPAEDLEAACDDVVTRVSEVYDAETVLEAFLGGSDAAVTDSFTSTIEDAFSEFGITFDPTSLTE